MKITKYEYDELYALGKRMLNRKIIEDVCKSFVFRHNNSETDVSKRIGELVNGRIRIVVSGIRDFCNNLINDLDLGLELEKQECSLPEQELAELNEIGQRESSGNVIRMNGKEFKEALANGTLRLPGIPNEIDEPENYLQQLIREGLDYFLSESPMYEDELLKEERKEEWRDRVYNQIVEQINEPSIWEENDPGDNF